MIYPTLNILSILIFLSGIFGIVSIRTVIKNESKQDYINIISGLSLLTLFSVAKLFSINNLFQDIPFLKEMVFFELAYWIGIISGMALLINGVSTWLPVYRKHQKVNNEKIEQLKLFKKIEQLIRVENRINIILLSALEMIVSHYNISQGACYLFSNKRKEMVFKGFYSQNKEFTINESDICFNKAQLNNFTPHVSILAAQSKYESMSLNLEIPLHKQNKLLGTFLFSVENDFDTELIDNLKIISEIITDKILLNISDMKKIHTIKHSVWDRKLFDKIDLTKGIKENIAKIKSLLKSAVSVDYLSIYTESGSRISIHENNQVLDEVKHTSEPSQSLERYIQKNNIPVVINNLEREVDFIVDPIILKTDMKSLAAFPVTTNNKVTSVLVVASQAYNSYDKKSEPYLNSICRLLNRLIANDAVTSKEFIVEKRRTAVTQYINDITRISHFETLYKRAVSTIFNFIQPTIVRLSLLEEDRRFLNSTAMEVGFKHDLLTPEKASMMLSLMPAHQAVLRDRKTYIFNDSSTDQFLSPDEQRQIYGNELQQALLVPLVVRSKVIGVISIAKDKSTSDHNFTENEIRFVEDIANITSLGTIITSLTKNSLLETQKQQQIKSSDSMTVNRLKSSLTGILGSVELLKEYGPHEEKYNRYLSIIGKSAQQITQELQEEITK